MIYLKVLDTIKEFFGPGVPFHCLAVPVSFDFRQDARTSDRYYRY